MAGEGSGHLRVHDLLVNCHPEARVLREDLDHLEKSNCLKV